MATPGDGECARRNTGHERAVPDRIMDRRTVRTNRIVMQRPIDTLREDHRLTTLASRVLAAIAAHTAAGRPFPAADCAVVLRFLREWVLPVHMHKEDAVLAPVAAMRGDADIAAIVGKLMLLHEEIAELAHALVLFWEPREPLTDVERAGFVATVRALVARLEHRQWLEEESLFPTCEQCVPPDDRLGWQEQFDAIDEGRRSPADWGGEVEALAHRWLD